MQMSPLRQPSGQQLGSLAGQHPLVLCVPVLVTTFPGGQQKFFASSRDFEQQVGGPMTLAEDLDERERETGFMQVSFGPQHSAPHFRAFLQTHLPFEQTSLERQQP